MNVLIWFRRDLRVTDHPALARAAALGRVLPVCVLAPDDWSAPEASARQYEFMAETLAGLRADLARLGAPLVVRCGAPDDVILRLARSWKIDLVLYHAGDGSAAARLAEARVTQRLAAAGIRSEAVRETPAAADTLVDGDAAPDPVALRPVAGIEPGQIPHARALGLAADPCRLRPAGGRDRALLLLEGLLRRGPGPAPEGGFTGERRPSQLSPWLALGALAPADLAGVRMLQPGLEARADCRRRMAGLALPAAAAPAGAAAAFERGETGLPFVDACLRALRATGRLAAPGRRLLALTALHLLGIDQTGAGQALARLSCDYDPAILWPQMAMAAAARAVDPVRFGREHDPDGQFLRRWLPELSAVPDPDLHSPWRWSGARSVLGRRYPEPLIDPATALRDARDRLPRRSLPGPNPGLAARPAGHSRLERVVIWPSPRAPAAAGGGAQLSLDL